MQSQGQWYNKCRDSDILYIHLCVCVCEIITIKCVQLEMCSLMFADDLLNSICLFEQRQ